MKKDLDTNTVNGSALSYLGEESHPLSRYFDEFLLIPFGSIDDQTLHFMICLKE